MRLLSSLLRLKIRGRLVAGFAALCAIVALAVGINLRQSLAIQDDVREIAQLRAPVAVAALGIARDVYASIAALRGYVLTGAEEQKTVRAATWQSIEAASGRMDELVRGFTNPRTPRMWREARGVLAELDRLQVEIEALAGTPQAFPGMQIMTREGMPRADRIFAEISRMIDRESTLPATDERKALLKDMADVRGNGATAIAMMRAYLLSGDESLRTRFEELWANSERALAQLATRAALLDEVQAPAFAALRQTRTEFKAIAERIVASRAGADWNRPV